jgi:hypothetical protein
MSTQERAVRPQAATAPSPPELVAGLDAFPGRGAGTDAERRAANWLAGELAGRGMEAAVEPFWCRPNWALAQAWHAGLAVAGSLVSVASGRVGGGMLLAALVFVIVDAATGQSPGRLLTPQRASQNVVATPRRSGEPAAKDTDGRIHLILTANYDAGRTAMVYRDLLRTVASALRQPARRLAPGWIGWLAIAIIWLLATAILRVEGHHSTAVGIAQLLPTIGLLAAAVLLLEQAGSDFSPAAGDNGTGVSVALLLGRALAVSPPANLDVEVLLTGAGDGDGWGLRRYLAARHRGRRPQNTVVLGIAACGAGQPRWWRSDGSLFPLGYAPRLRRLAEQLAAEQPQLGLAPYRGRGSSPALAARRARVPALALGCLDDRGLVPRSHQPADVVAAVDRRAHDRTLQCALMLVDAIDAALASTRSDPKPG